MAARCAPTYCQRVAMTEPPGPELKTVWVRNKAFRVPRTYLVLDFLGEYLKITLGSDWGNAELKKPFDERHPLIQWYDALCRHQQETIKTPGVPHQAKAIGVMGAYLGLAHGLCTIDNQVDIPSRLLDRLRDKANFQGAYYEVMVASGLARAGFQLEFEDEGDGSTKHCELSARSPLTGKTYSVEARMRAVDGLFGKSAADGSRKNSPVAKLGQHLNGAFAKPSKGERMIFIDLNTIVGKEVSDENRPQFLMQVNKRIVRYEQRELPVGKRAYVVITAFDYHRSLDTDAGLVAMPYGLGIDFNKAGKMRMLERYKQDRLHIDAIAAAEGFAQHSKFPKDFGSAPTMPSVLELLIPKSKLENDYDLFKWLVLANRGRTRQQMLDWFSKGRDLTKLAALSDEDLFLEYCEAHVASFNALKSPGETTK